MRRVMVLMASSIVVMSGCSPSPPADVPEPAPQSSTPTPPTVSADLQGRRGTIVTSEKVAEPSAALLKSGATQYLISYRSVSGVDSSEREISGSIVVPSGEAPPGGWPVIAYGHGLTGVTNDCGPSGYQDLLGYDQVVASLIDLGFVVTLTDFEGLGHWGIHPLLEPTTAAYNMIDSVRAALKLRPDVSSRWFAVGISQGGQASWAANELAGEYGDGLTFLGSASLSPAADLSGLPALAESGWLTKEQQVLLPSLVYGLKVTHPDLRPDDYLHGALSRDTTMWLACTGPLAQKRSNAVGELTLADSVPVSPAATKALTEALENVAVAQRKATGPMLVITGGDDETVREQWVAAAVRRACAFGDTVEFVVRPGEGHSDLNGGPRVAEWLTERLAGAPVPDTC
jgi:Secretory lipase